MIPSDCKEFYLRGFVRSWVVRCRGRMVRGWVIWGWVVWGRVVCEGGGYNSGKDAKDFPHHGALK